MSNPAGIDRNSIIFIGKFDSFPPFFHRLSHVKTFLMKKQRRRYYLDD